MCNYVLLYVVVPVSFLFKIMCRLYMYFCYPVLHIADTSHRVLHTASLAISLEGSRASTTSPCNRRILREINEFRRNPHTDIEIFPSEDK